MDTLRFVWLLSLFTLFGCNGKENSSGNADTNIHTLTDSLLLDSITNVESGPLLLTDFKSMDDLKRVIDLEYARDFDNSVDNPRVCLTNHCRGRVVTSILEPGISEADFNKAKSGFWNKVRVVLKSPFALINGNDLVRVEILGRRRYTMFGKADVAFYDLAAAMVKNIYEADTLRMPTHALSEKGYLNTFNHVLAQSFMTSLYSEAIADYVADVHERYTMPELITGNFTEAQLSDIDKGPVDNYVDMINNEWGQELGKTLKEKYNIYHWTNWTPELLASYLNDIQSYHSWIFKIGFRPFRETDEIVIYFAGKINTVNRDISRLKKFY